MKSAATYILASLAPSTRTLYARAIVRLQLFALSLSHDRTWFPCSVSLICMFIAHFFDSALARATVATNLSGISFFHKLFRHPDHTNDFLVKRLGLEPKRSAHPTMIDYLSMFPCYTDCMTLFPISPVVPIRLPWCGQCFLRCFTPFCV